MPKVGTMGLDMMFRTATVQANLDYADEADMVRKMRVSLALQPIATALFANSPFTDGKPNGFVSMRSQIWLNTDKDRTGMLDFAFEPGFSFASYVDWALDVPLYFVKRGDVYHDVAGASFRDLLAGQLVDLPGERATLSDWANHLSTLFPEVRLKRYLEMRGSDVGSEAMINALPALWVGIFYDGASLSAAESLIAGWSRDERQTLRREVPRTGLKTPFRGHPLNDVARDMVAIARDGLRRRAQRDANGRDEARYLEPLEMIVVDGLCPADHWLADYESAWNGSVQPAFEATRLA
jgi:glutamate--cysteine ligase